MAFCSPITKLFLFFFFWFLCRCSLRTFIHSFIHSFFHEIYKTAGPPPGSLRLHQKTSCTFPLLSNFSRSKKGHRRKSTQPTHSNLTPQQHRSSRLSNPIQYARTIPSMHDQDSLEGDISIPTLPPPPASSLKPFRPYQHLSSHLTQKRRPRRSDLQPPLTKKTAILRHRTLDRSL